MRIYDKGGFLVFGVFFFLFFGFFVFVFVFVFVLVFLGLHPQHVEVPRLGVQLELYPPAYTTAIAMPEPSHIYDLYPSSWQPQILNLLSKARDRTHIFMDTSQVPYCWAMTGTPNGKMLFYSICDVSSLIFITWIWIPISYLKEKEITNELHVFVWNKDYITSIKSTSIELRRRYRWIVL